MKIERASAQIGVCRGAVRTSTTENQLMPGTYESKTADRRPRN
jgi:hypothetical protein